MPEVRVYAVAVMYGVPDVGNIFLLDLSRQAAAVRLFRVIVVALRAVANVDKMVLHSRSLLKMSIKTAPITKVIGAKICILL